MAGTLKRIYPPLYQFLVNSYKGFTTGLGNKFYSQEGEDMILNRFFGFQKTGFYVDVGAHHPQRFSNTCFFYKKGWHGINIDCNPGSMLLFRLHRRRDINLELAVSDKVEIIRYHKFREPAVNGFVVNFSDDSAHSNMLLKTINIKTVTLEHVLDSHLPVKTSIDFLTIDVEGMDLKVLRSNNWTKYRPKIVLVEDVFFNYNYTADSAIVRFMNSLDYILFAKTVNTFIFRERYLKLS